MPSMNNQAITDPHRASGEERTACGKVESAPESTLAPSPANGRKYWRSVDELADTEAFRRFVHREFPASAMEMLDSNDRRQFLKLMGASFALAGLGMAGCRRWPEEKIAPYANRPAGHAPGTTNAFATSMELNGVASALLVTSYDFRPIKIEGNPQHPINQGATDALAQASILNLYDPDRSRLVLHGGKASDWPAFVEWVRQQGGSWRNARGGGLAILCESTSSPSMHSMKQRLLKAYPNANWHEYEPLNNDNAVQGSKLAFGSPHRSHYAFDKASVIVSLDADFLDCSAGSAGIKWSRDFAAGRKADDRKSMSRLYAFESALSLTGMKADHRIAMRSADVAVVAARLAAAIVPGAANALQAAASTKVAAPVDSEQVDRVVEHVIADLQHASGASIVVAGPRQPAEVHLLAHMMNEALGNVGKTVHYTAMPDAVPHLESIRSLVGAIEAGQVHTLVIIGGNPAYNAPADINFAGLLKKVQNSVHLSEYVDETSKACAWHINRAHYLEAWGDGRSFDGTVTLGQPLIEPLFNGKSAIELLAVVAGDESTSGYDIVRRTIGEMRSGIDFESFWRQSLHDGFIPNSANAPANATVNRDAIAAGLSEWQQRIGTAASGGADQIEVVFIPSAATHDGRFANNGWLQEMPDPVTKLTWDNAIIMSPAAAKSRGLASGDLVTLRVGGAEVTAAIMPLPAQFAGSVTVALGYGRRFQGRVSHGAGFDFYPLRRSDAMGFVTGATIAKAGGSYVLATTQDHHPVDTVGGKGAQERLPTLFREATLHEYQEHPDFVNHRTHVVHRLSLWEEDLSFHNEGEKTRYAWGMSIDLNACTGCNACVIACQAENNIPIVGKEQVHKGREMHWIRVDRYFRGHSDETPEGFVMAPVTCMHCENAPCEQVCPVAATTHDDQGLNVMVYNRCVGTRYCSNNCPYKVRKFNYFDFHVREPHREQPGILLQVEPDYYTKGQAVADPLKQLQFNPEVTVRMRGIMEKCTYCVQRITKARIDAKNQWVKQKNLDPNAPLNLRVPIADGAVTPACAQACPSQAIVFGDLNDPNSQIARLQRHERSYQMLEELNTKPRTRYMAKISNPNPALAGESATEAHHG